MRGPKDVLQVGAVELVPLHFGGLAERHTPEEIVADVVHEHLGRTVAFDGAGGEGVELVGVADVAHVPVDLCGEAGDELGIDVGHDHRRTVANEQIDDASTDARAAAGYDGDAANEKRTRSELHDGPDGIRRTPRRRPTKRWS